MPDRKIQPNSTRGAQMTTHLHAVSMSLSICVTGLNTSALNWKINMGGGWSTYWMVSPSFIPSMGAACPLTLCDTEKAGGPTLLPPIPSLKWSRSGNLTQSGPMSTLPEI